MGTWIVGAVIVCIIGLALWKVYKEQKNGKGCGHGCEVCSCRPGCPELDGSRMT